MICSILQISTNSSCGDSQWSGEISTEESLSNLIGSTNNYDICEYPFIKPFFPDKGSTMKKVTTVAAIAICVLLGTGYAAVTMEAVTFEDMKQKNLEGNTLRLATCWEAIGIDPDDRLYVVYGNNDKGSPTEDCSVFMYDSRTGERKALGTLRKTAHEEGTLRENEPLPKGHTPVVYYKGKMYFGTQNFHEAGSGDSQSMLESRYHGSHIFSIDTETFELHDEARHMPEQCFQRGQGLIGLAPMPWNNCIVGFSHPKGDLVIYNPETHDVTINYHDPDHLARPGRIVVPTSYNKIFTFQTSQKLGVYEIGAEARRFTDESISYYFMNGRAISKDGKKAYVCDHQARLWRLGVENEKLIKIGGFGGWSNKDVRCYGLTFSLDEKKVYGITTTSELYEYDEESGEIQKLLGIGTIGEGGFSGYNCTDSKGNIYFARHKFSHPKPCGILKFDVRDRTGPSPYPSVASKRPAGESVKSTERAASSRVPNGSRLYTFPRACTWVVRGYTLRGRLCFSESGRGTEVVIDRHRHSGSAGLFEIKTGTQRITITAPPVR
jgi:hypothetical protein